MAQPEPQPVPSTSCYAPAPPQTPSTSVSDPALARQLPPLPASDVPFEQIQMDEVTVQAGLGSGVPTTQGPLVVQPYVQLQNGHPSGSNMGVPASTPITPNTWNGNVSASLDSNSRMTLVPGYRQVEEFGPDEEYEDEEEVVYVTFDLGSIEPTLIPSSKEYRVIGLDTPNPFLQLSGTILKGRHESLLGTELLFTEVKDDEDPSKRHLSFVSTNEQRVHFKEVQLVPKHSAAPPLTNEPKNNVVSTAKGKGKAKEGSVEGSAEAPETGMLDRMTGKDQPAKRARRASTKGKEKNKSPPRRRSTRKGKEKQTYAEDEGGGEDDDEDDMYVDDD